MSRFCVTDLADAIKGGIAVSKGLGSLRAEKPHVLLRDADVTGRLVRHFGVDGLTVNDRKFSATGADFGQSHGSLDRDGIGSIADDPVVVKSGHPINLTRSVHSKVLHVGEEHHARQTVRFPVGTGHLQGC